MRSSRGPSGETRKRASESTPIAPSTRRGNASAPKPRVMPAGTPRVVTKPRTVDWTVFTPISLPVGTFASTLSRLFANVASGRTSPDFTCDSASAKLTSAASMLPPTRLMTMSPPPRKGTITGFCSPAARATGLQNPVIVPFRGGGDIVINLVGGNIDAALVNFAEAESQVKSGDVRPLATFANSRLSVLANVPTGKEIGVNTVQSTVRGFVTTRGVPEDRVKALEQGLVKAMEGQMFQTYLETSGQAKDSVTGAGPWKAQLDAFMQEGKQTLEALGLL